ncbi:hypothetical protein [Calothrix sp. NIES-3974]|uniref:hypothetical protein n=1 Tax=Calothrix sp. NIES-3974 TaxID=2005462 RepID=UPI000B6198F5|nr:hypothetical protein [Calothrix sp. NIES-3974]BAZ05123.1 hypothetical protein NIES3974_17690 [Calothrix sp. NIES-3974]
MTPNPSIMKAVETLGYRVTVGDVATQAGLNIAEANQGLLVLASDVGGHLQVAESGDIVYLFPKDFRTILKNKYFQLQLQETWQKVWNIVFYLIRISFGIILIASIVLISIAIVIIITSLNNSDNDSRGDSDFKGGNFFVIPDIWWYLSPDYYSGNPSRRHQNNNQSNQQKSELNFLEAVFSFLFGDGNPNADLEERRWQEIAAVINKNRGAIIAEQIAPYLDDIGETYQQEYEDYMLPVLVKFNGKPQVSPDGELVYYFPELQVKAAQKRQQKVAPFLQELPWKFSKASSGQLILSGGLGCVNLIGALILGAFLLDGTIASEIGGLVGFVQGIYWLLLAYGIGFLAIPLVRYFWIQHRNRKISQRNRMRMARTAILENQAPKLQKKLSYAKQFANQQYITEQDVTYSTETDLLEQEVKKLTDTQ